MITPITINILGTPSRVGGRRTTSATYTEDVFWDESLGKYKYNDRIMATSPSAVVTMLFTDVPPLDPNTTRIVKDGKTYKIVDIMQNLLSPIALDGTYEFLVSELKEI